MIAFQSLWSLQDFISWNQTVMDRSAGSFSLSKAKSIVSFVQLGGRAQKLPPLILTRFSFFKKSEEDEKVQKKKLKATRGLLDLGIFRSIVWLEPLFFPLFTPDSIEKEGLNQVRRGKIWWRRHGMKCRKFPLVCLLYRNKSIEWHNSTANIIHNAKYIFWLVGEMIWFRNVWEVTFEKEKRNKVKL